MTHNRGYSIDVSKVTIKKMSTGGEIDIVGGDAGGMGSLLLTLTMTEDILKSAITGNMVIKNPGRMIEEFNITGQDEVIHIEMNTPHLEDSEHVLEFCIVSVNEFGDSANTISKRGGPIKDSKSQLHFMSCEPMYLDIADWKGGDGEILNQDMFVKISDGAKSGIAGAIEEVLEWAGLNEEDGLVDTIAPKYFNGKPGQWMCGKQSEGMDIEGTKNTIWLKTNPQLYPWGKETNSMTLMQLMNNLAENAIDENETWCNYVFYHDFDKWHFKSIKKMVEENKNNIPKANEAGNIETTRKYVYALSDGASLKEETDTGDPKVLKSVSVTSANHLQIWKQGAYSTYYHHVQPDYSDPYHYYMDTATIHKNKFIDYDFHREWDDKSWKLFSIENYKYLPDAVPTKIDAEKPNKNLRFRNIPEVYGYLGDAYNSNNPHNKSDFLSSRAGDGSLGKRNDVMWQAMSDQTDLKLEKIKIIQQDVIGPTRGNYIEYLFKKNLKEKWNIYRHTICCDKIDDKRQFLAIIDNATLVQDNGKGGIYEYEWREVEMWPANDSEESEGGEIVSSPDSPITIVVVPEDKGGLQSPGELRSLPKAYNLNELMNTQEGDDVFVGPGINASEKEGSYPEANDYPEGHKMMPVGGYWKLGDDPCEDSPHFHKHIVEMNVISDDMLETITPIGEEEEEEQGWDVIDKIYFFDVQNAHDGLCSCPNPI